MINRKTCPLILWIAQNKTSARLGIEITGELAATIARINARP